MIVLHVVVNKEELATSVIHFLLEKQLVFTAEYSETVFFDMEPESRTIKKRIAYSIKGTTKALLFQRIQKSLEKEFKKKVKALYATPVVYMERKQANALKNTTLAV